MVGKRTFDVELKQLAILEEIFRTRSVTKAALNLGLSQPSISVGLARLRRYFNDPLFVRTSEGMQPTRLTEQLIKPLSDALRLVDQTLGAELFFDPSSSERTFRICMADIGNVVILPRLLAHLRSVAPGLHVEIVPSSADEPRLLESGDADLAIGVPARLQAGFHQQRLFQEQFVCLAATGHPRVKDSLTLRQFRAEAHIVVTTPWTSHWLVERYLAAKRVPRKVSLRLSSCFGLARIIAATDLLVTLPKRVGNELAASGHVRMFPDPVGIPGYAVRQYWHGRYHHDPDSKWLRETIAKLFVE